MKTVIDKQAYFEKKVCEILNFKGYLSQRDSARENMILDDCLSNISHLDTLSGTIGYSKGLAFNCDYLLIATKDSEVNYISEISLKMIMLIIEYYSNDKNKIIFATNIPIEIHSDKVKELKKDFNFHIENIGYSFCQKHNLEFTAVY
jgi:hypothetical protein